MTKRWSSRSTQDKLRVFVSSTIHECTAERSIAKEVITSLNHQPVLFEKLGSRPYPARDLYLSRLRDSQIMVAIYKSGYGYIDAANGMNISGLEDELRFAQERGIETLFYFLRSPENRDLKLQALIDEIKSTSTVCFYDEPEELREFVRDDLTTLITDKFLRADDQRRVLRETSKDVLDRTLLRAGVVVARPTLIEALSEASRKSPTLCLYGPAGIGKTTLAAQFADAEAATFVRVSGLPPRDLFSVVAKALQKESVDAYGYLTLEGARLALAAAWSKVRAVTMVLDECEFIPELLDTLSAGGGTTSDKRLVYTSREASDVIPCFEVPQLSRAEAQEFVEQSGIAAQSAPDLIEIRNPLNLQQALLKRAFDSTSLSQITGTAGEVLRYVAVSTVPLSADDILFLRADDRYSIEMLYTDISHLRPLIDDSPRGFRLMHAETASAIAKEMRETPQRYRFYVNRLIRLFQNAGDLPRAYELASLLNDGREKSYAEAAAREAVRMGDWRFAVRLIDQLLQEALDNESKVEAFYLMLSLSYPVELMGDAQRAAELLDRAEPLAEVLGSSFETKLEEARLSSKARRDPSLEYVAALKDIHKRYGDHQQFWDQARVGVELSAIYISAKEFEKARDILRPTLEAFEALGDDYGIDLAQRNLASALSGLPGHDQETEELIRTIEERTRDEPDVRRQRAWLCNLHTRRLRRAGRYEEAETLAKEAIDIGSALGDESLRAVNFINLGNNYRDQRRTREAVESYEAAAIAAQKVRASRYRSRLVSLACRTLQRLPRA